MASLFNQLIRFSLQHRLLVAIAALFVLVYGGWQAYQLPIDVFPDLNRPRVVIITEAEGLAPEEIETLVTLPIETAINGASGVQAVRSFSSVSISIVYVEFDWGTDIFLDRQIVTERLATVSEKLPDGVNPQLAPISSIMGQIVMVGMFIEPSSTTSGPSGEATSPMQLRTLADWVVRQQLLTIPGVSQVFVMGGQRKQFQVLVDPDLLTQYGVTLHEVKTALRESNQNATGGYLDEQGPQELLVRAIGRIKTIDDLKDVVIKSRSNRPVLLEQVATVLPGAQVKRGDSAALVKLPRGPPDRDENGSDVSATELLDQNPEAEIVGGPAVVLSINKQPGADTRRVSQAIQETLRILEDGLPGDVRIESDLYQQSKFIDLAIANVLEALRDGSILVVVVLFLFLLNFRTTFITLTAIPISIVVTALVFQLFGMEINTMTLGGLAVAMGELVDDAIVGVENVFRRLKENQASDNPQPALIVVYKASAEVRNPIVFGTMIVVLVFVPLFALSGMEGRLFTPLGIAYIVSLVSSLVVSLTVTPVLSYWLLPSTASAARHQDALMVRGLKWLSGLVIGMSLRMSYPVLLAAAAVVALTVLVFIRLDRDFLPPFNEGAVQVNAILPPGTSLRESTQIAEVVERRLIQVPEVEALVRRTGRAELDEHAEGVHATEIVATLDSESHRSREVILEDIRSQLTEIPGVNFSVEQPIAHLISHMLSGVKAQVAIKLYGDDLQKLRSVAREIEAEISEIVGIEDLQIEPQVTVPQLRIEIDSRALRQVGLTRVEVTDLVETAMNGVVVSEVVDGQRKFDLLIRLDERFREDLDALRRLTIPLPNGGTTKLESVAKIFRDGGPNTINREQVRRRIVVQCNVSGRGLVDVVDEIKSALQPIEAELPTGYFIEYGGQFESQQSATQLISILTCVALLGMLLVLYTMFQSVNLSLQVMVALPMAFVGGVVALLITNQTVTIAALVGFISLCGIASRNGILLINHYLQLVSYEGYSWDRSMIIKAGQQRLAPVLMTALTSGIGLIPLALSAGEPGKEILYPVATVIIGGLITSTLLEFVVRPALFWEFGIGAAKRVIAHRQQESLL